MNKEPKTGIEKVKSSRDGIGALDFNPFAAELMLDPAPAYHRLREAQPISWSPALQAWVMTRMQDVQAVLADPAFEAIPTAKIVHDIGIRANKDYSALVRFLDATLFFKSGADHMRDRRSITKVLNRVPLSRLDGVIRGFAADLALDIAGRSSYNIIADFAEPFPQLVMAYIVGLPAEDVPVLGSLLSEVTLVFDPASITTLDRLAEKAGVAFELLERRIKAAANGTGLSIIYEGAAGEDKKAKLGNAAATALFTLRVGAETTIGLVGLIARALIMQPDLRATLKERPDAIDRFVEEILRLQSNVQRAARIAIEDRNVGGQTIKSGERVLLLIGAANRDPEVFSAPDDIELTEDRADHVAFGAAAHFCIGASLARLEGVIAVETLLNLPLIEAAGLEEWYTGRSIRRLTSLPVRCSA